MTLTKADIVETIAKQKGYTISRSFEVIESLLEIIKSQLESGQDVLISGVITSYSIHYTKLYDSRQPI